MTKIYVISDTHFCHDNMYKFTRLDGITRVRPEFTCSADADAEMVMRWNAIVRPEDHVWHLGDIGMGPRALRFVKLLLGHKRIVLGNHDKFKPQEYLAAGFQKVQGSAYKDGIWLTHIPVHPDGLYGGRINAHGHIHERHIMRTEPVDPNRATVYDTFKHMKDPRYVNVCVEQTDYRPILLEEVRERHQKMDKAWRGLDYGAKVV